jgi:ABC-type transport system substrate-binding protein
VQKHAPILTLILTIAALTVQASAATPQNHTPATSCIIIQCAAPTWSPYGPREKSLTITDYGDLTSEFNAFLNGQIDILDSGLFASQQNVCNNSDVFCTSPQTTYSLFDLEINHNFSFLGVALQAHRQTIPPSLVLPATMATSGCSTGFGQLTLKLENQEVGDAAILDSLNRLTISSQPVGTFSNTVADSGGAQPTGTYTFPCVVAGTYKITSSEYDVAAPCSTSIPTSCINIGSGQSVTTTLLANWKSSSSKQPTIAGLYIPRALAHLIDRPSFVNSAPLGGGSAVYDDEWSSPAQNLPNTFSLTAECSDHPWFSPCSPVSAYNFVSDNIGGGSEWWTQPGVSAGVTAGYSGVSDLRAACENFVKAGFTVTGGRNSTDCGDVALASLGTTAPSAYPHLSNNGKQIFFFVRADPARRAFGQVIADGINFLFGTPNNGQTIPNQTPPCTVLYDLSSCITRYSSFTTILQCIFQVPLGILGTCNFNIYTGGFHLNTVPDGLYQSFHSSSAGICGSTGSLNYVFYCDPEFDTYASAGEFSSTSTQAYSFFSKAAATGILDGMAVPIYTPISVYTALNGWNNQVCSSCGVLQSSLVPVLGNGFSAGNLYWSSLNMRQVLGYVPANANYKPGGGNPNLIRRGFSEDVFSLSPFQAITTHELEIVSLLYDSLLQTNPLTLGTDGQYMDWQTLAHSSVFNPNEVSCNAINGCVTGTTTTTWRLRSDLFFQDGTRLTASDVVYTILAYRDVSSASFFPDVSSVSSATTLSSTLVQVKLQGNGFNEVTNLGMIPIIPAHIWEPICGPIVNGTIPSGPTSSCANPTFDPMAQGIMIGDGPWACVTPAGFPNAGHVGGSCTITFNFPFCQPHLSCLSGQATQPGDQIVLTRNTQYMRCCSDDTSSSLYKFSWADKFNSGIVRIQDIADIALHWQKPDPYWVNANIAPGNTVNIGDLSVVALYFGNGITGTIPWQQMTGIDPQIDPFFCPSSGC